MIEIVCWSRGGQTWWWAAVSRDRRPLLIGCLTATGAQTAGWWRRTRQTRPGRCWRWPARPGAWAGAGCAWRTCQSSLLLCHTGKKRHRRRFGWTAGTRKSADTAEAYAQSRHRSTKHPNSTERSLPLSCGFKLNLGDYTMCTDRTDSCPSLTCLLIKCISHTQTHSWSSHTCSGAVITSHDTLHISFTWNMEYQSNTDAAVTATQQYPPF